MFYFLQNMRWNLNANYLKEQLGITRCNGLLRQCSKSNSKSSIPAMKHHRMTDQAESLTIELMQIPFRNMTPRIFLHNSTLEAEGITSSRMVRTNSSVTCHIPDEQNPQLHCCENLHTHQLQSNYTILQSNVRHSQSLVLNS